MEELFSERSLIRLYREWSERNWAAGFMEPAPDIVRAFRANLIAKEPEPEREFTDYERRFLEEYINQAKAALPQPSEETT